MKGIPIPADMVLVGSETVKWFSPESAVEGQACIVSGGIAYRKGNDWFTLTGCEWPGRKIEWDVQAWTPLLYSPERSR